MGIEAGELAPSRRTSPVVIVVLILAILVALALVWFFVVSPLFFAADEEEPLPPVARPPAAEASPTPSPSPTQPTETFEVFESRDPFRPLVAAGGPAPAGTPAPGASPAPGAGAAGAPAPSGGQRVTLLDVFDDAGTTKAQIKVGSTVYTVAPGEVFAGNFKLVSISGNCATLLHGDDKFTLCEGEEVIK